MGSSGRVRTGLEVLLARKPEWLRRRRIGLLTHAAAVGHTLRSNIDLLADNGAQLIALYGPEHGVRGDSQAGDPVHREKDPRYGIPVFSLYGQETRLIASHDLDARMRSFDVRPDGKKPSPEMLQDVELMLCDLQDVGTRVYTYAATLAYVMEACAAAEIEVVVLDRPNPIGGLLLEGTLLESPEFASPVAALPVPLRHGMTIGELALLANAELFAGKVNLTVVPLKGWCRQMWFDQTGLPWVPPSPNMPTVDTATVYPGQVFFEGTNVSEGRGTTRPFELIGAPWIDGPGLGERLNRLKLPGVCFRPTWFTPAFSKYSGQLCSGVQFHVTDRRRFRPFAAMLHFLHTLRQMSPESFRFHADYFDRIMGGSRLRRMLDANRPVPEMVSSLAPGLQRFTRRRHRYLLYP